MCRVGALARILVGDVAADSNKSTKQKTPYRPIGFSQSKREVGRSLKWETGEIDIDFSFEMEV